jgi:hypothetical protein
MDFALSARDGRLRLRPNHHHHHHHHHHTIEGKKQDSSGKEGL